MSDAAWAAFWTGFWGNLASIITAAIGGCVLAYMTWRNGQKAEAAKSAALATKEELLAQVCEVRADLQTVRLTPEQMEMLREGAGRIAVNEYKANTQPAQLSGK